MPKVKAKQVATSDHHLVLVTVSGLLYERFTSKPGEPTEPWHPIELPEEPQAVSKPRRKRRRP
jgi:hypothetical protein